MPVAGNGGTCCECAQLTGCDCITSVACSLSCEKKSGSASLCGIPEYTTPSDPPRIYRKQTLSGERLHCRYTSLSNCSTPLSRTTSGKWSGAYAFNRDTCVITNTQLSQSGTETPGGCSPVALTSSNSEPLNAALPSAFCNFGTTVTKTKVTYPQAVLSCNAQGGICSGDYIKELGDEDMDEDAEARAAAAITLWTSCAGCADTACSAFRTDRSGTSDTFFGFRVVRTRVTWTAIPFRSYAVTVHFARRLLGSGGPFLDLGLLHESTVYAETGTGISDYIDVPNEAGWETIASGCEVELVP